MSSQIAKGVMSSLKVGLGLKISEAALNWLKHLQIDWLQNYEQALEKAVTTSGDPAMGAQLVMAVFTGSDWCPYCQALDTEVLHSVEFRLWFNQHLMVPLWLDYPHNTPQSDEIKAQNAKLLAQYGISGFPTVVAIKAATGACLPNGQCVISTSEVGRVVGYAPGSGADAWIANFSAAAKIQ